jgi:hypothetical protein
MNTYKVWTTDRHYYVIEAKSYGYCDDANAWHFEDGEEVKATIPNKELKLIKLIKEGE